MVRDHSTEEIEDFLIKANRQFYGNSRGDAYIREGIQKFGAAVLLEEMTKQFNKLMDIRYGVFSLAKRPNNMALWAKYADDHKGYCLEFSDLSKFANVREVRYAQKLPLTLNLEIDPGQADFLFTKSHEWSNEEEARILSLPSGYQLFPQGALTGILFGERCKAADQDTIQTWVKECNTKIVLRKSRFNIARQELEFLTI